MVCVVVVDIRVVAVLAVSERKVERGRQDI